MEGLPPVPEPPVEPDFAAALHRHGCDPLRRGPVRTLQVNLGKRCNMACLHCHVDAGPKRTEVMERRVAERVVALLDRSASVEVVDLTGGAPELNPSFCWLVEESRDRGRRVIDRCNLTILLEPSMRALPTFLAAHEVHVVASLPCYLEENVEKQRGRGAFAKSIQALRRLNALGYGHPDTGLLLDLVYNPVGPSLPPDQGKLEARYRTELRDRFGIEFSRLLALTNLPIARFAESLARSGRAEEYQALLVEHFNPDTVAGLMCRTTVSVSWDGRLFDCDFHQMTEHAPPRARTVWDLASLDELEGEPIRTAPHCFGCTAGAGSSCGGALAG